MTTTSYTVEHVDGCDCRCPVTVRVEDEQQPEQPIAPATLPTVRPPAVLPYRVTCDHR